MHSRRAFPSRRSGECEGVARRSEKIVSNEINRREFIAATTILAGAAISPAAVAEPPPAAAATATVVLFQGDSITDAGRTRDSAEPNAAGAPRKGYPPLASSALPSARAPTGPPLFYPGRPR